MKILFLHPPWPGPGYGGRSQNRWPRKRGDKSARYPLYLCYTATLLKTKGYEVSYIDSVMQNLDEQATLSKIQSINPEIIFTETTTPTINYDIQFVDKVKSILPGSKYIFAGSHPSYFPEEVLKNSKVDIIVRGEQDITTLNAINSVKNKTPLKNVKGISFKDKNRIIHNEKAELIPNLDELPFPDRNLIPHQLYIEGHALKKPFTFIMTSRGCPNRCTFCLWPSIYFERKVRFRTINNVMAEIEWLISKYNMKEVFIDDGTFNITKQRVMDFCNELIKRGISISWGCSARVDRVDEEMLSLMKKSGCRIICYGPESSSKKTLELTKKGINLDQTKNAIALTKKAGIIAHANFMFGFPWETKEDIRATINYCLELNPDTAQFSLVFPHPGSEMYEEAVEKGWFYDDMIGNWDNFEMSKGAVLKSGMSREELSSMISYAHKKFFLRPGYVLSSLAKVKNINELKRLFRGANSVIKGKILFKKK